MPTASDSKCDESEFPDAPTTAAAETTFGAHARHPMVQRRRCGFESRFAHLHRRERQNELRRERLRRCNAVLYARLFYRSSTVDDVAFCSVRDLSILTSSHC